MPNPVRGAKRKIGSPRAKSESRGGAHGWAKEFPLRNLNAHTPAMCPLRFLPILLLPASVALAAPPVESEPLSPADSMKKIHVRVGYGFELVASEPLTMDPVAIDWDTAGRMWVVEMADYPLGMDGNGKPGGRVRVLEDTDGDGRYDKSTLFAEGLNFPNGVLTWRDGVIITAAPDILFLRDTDGDGRADQREVLITGLLEGNQQLRANGLRWGLDNWVYCAAGGHHGNYGVDTKLRSSRAGTEVAIGSRDFRFRPDTGELEPESGPSQFGRNRDDWGNWFGTQNSRPLWHYVLADRYLRRNPHVPAPDPKQQVVVPLNPKVYPSSRQEKRFHSFNEAGHFTSACAGMIYRDELLFPRGERHAFTCEPFHNLVQHNVVTDEGVSFAAHRAPGEETSEFFSSEDRWCRPVMTRTGPDGALWIVDMYRYMIEHPQFLTDAGKAELLPHYRLGEERGRIYRVFPVGAKLRATPRLADLDTAALVRALDSSNEWQRDKAHQLLLTRSDPSAAALLAALTRESTNALSRLHALCVLDGLGALTPAHVIGALADAHPGVRANALRLAEKHGTPEVIAEAVKRVVDDDPKVRLQLACTLGEWKDPRAGEALGVLAVKDRANPFILAAVMSSAVPHTPAIIKAAREVDPAALIDLSEPLARIAWALGDRWTVGDKGTLDTLRSEILRSPDGTFSIAQMEAFGRWIEITDGREIDGPIVHHAIRMLNDEQQPVATRTAAAAMLVRDPARRVLLLKELISWLNPSESRENQRVAMKAFAETDEALVPGALLSHWASFTTETRAAAFDVLLTREPWAFALLEGMQKGAELSLDATQRGRLTRHSSARVRKLASTLFEAIGTRAAVIEKFRPALSLAGDGTRGKDVFARTCVACHKLGDLGNEVGPNLASVVEHPPEKLLINILDPNIDVQPGFYAYFCQFADGTELYGLMTSETGTSVTFKLLDGSTRGVLRKDIKSLRSANVSLMPEGLEAAMTPQDLADLIQFIRSGAKATSASASGANDLRVGAAAVNLKGEDDMVIAGSIEAHFAKGQEGELRATAVVVEKPGTTKVAIVTCDVLWVTREVVDAATAEIEKATGIPAANILVNATHTHHAPGTAPAHAFGWSEKFTDEVRRGIVQSVIDANARLSDAALYFQLGSEHTVGACSRLLLDDGNITWRSAYTEAGLKVQSTAAFDPQLPVLDFRHRDGSTRALIFNHSTHTIGTRSGRDVRSPSFYGLAAQELEKQLGAVVSFVEGASGSTHNIRGVPVPVAIERMKAAVLDARQQAVAVPVTRLASIKRPFTFRVRKFDEAVEDAKVAHYSNAFAPQQATRYREVFATARRQLQSHQGEERTTWLQVMLIGDIAIVGVPAEYFTALGLDIKKRSPFPRTYIAELANDWIGYLPDREGHQLGGYQTWTGLHSYAEPGTGERVADEAVKILAELARGQ